MGVPQRFYAPVCAWLAEQGFAALTFDYRGMGRSRTRPLRDERADVLTWAQQDAGAALTAIRQRVPGVPVTWIGHSLGGQIAPFVPGFSGVDKVVLVASGTGYWRHNALPTRRRVWLLWWGVAPLLTPVFGYFPGRRLKMVGDLPRGVIEQWRRWCLHPDYVVGVEGAPARERFAAVTQPLTCLSFDDDEMMSRQNIEALYGFYSNAAREWRHLRPEQLGMRRVGHFGFFREEARPAWDQHLLSALAA